MLDALGEETARLLRSAPRGERRHPQEGRGPGRAGSSRTPAPRPTGRAAKPRRSSQTRSAEAEAKAAELLAAAEARAAAALDAATAESNSIVDHARHQGREMLEEAKSARERVLGDLVRRRALLNGQIEELRGGRDRLLDAYRTVKRTFLEATEALAQVEARAAVERTTSHAEPIDIAAEIAAEIEELDAALPGGVTDSADAETADEHAASDSTGAAGSAADDEFSEHVQLVPASASDSATTEETEVATALADVDTLFARLRAGHDDAAASGETSESPTEAAADGPRISVDEWRERRSHAISPLSAPLLKKAKRRRAGRSERIARLGPAPQGPPHSPAGAGRSRRGPRRLGDGAAGFGRPRVPGGPDRGGP